jgi:hypothetical protein
LCSFAQNKNSPPKKPARTSTKHRPTKKIPTFDEYDFSGVDALIREEKEWPHVGNTSYSSVSYGAKTIRRLKGNIVRVWTKTTLKDQTNETKSEFLRIRKRQGSRPVGYENFSRTFELDEYNCTKGEGRVLSQVDYDEKGNVIDSTSYRNPGWDYVVPNSIGESLLRAVCKKPR